MSGGLRLAWIGLRPAPGVPVLEVDRALAERHRGLAGDHQGQGGLRPWRRREVTLVLESHRQAAEAVLGRPMPPALLRRNLLVEGTPDRPMVRGCRLEIGDVVLRITGPVPPCHRMDRAMGPGARDALRGRGGIAARVVRGGWLLVGAPVLLG